MPFFDECVRCVVGGPASVFIRFAAILFIPAGLGACILGARWVKKGKISESALVSFAVFGLIFGPLALILVTMDQPAKYTPLVLYQGPFDWPAGCANREYRAGDQISIACHNYRNTLPRKLLFDHGLAGLTERTEHDYFRVGSEAINFRCNYFTERCTVRYAEHNVFR